MELYGEGLDEASSHLQVTIKKPIRAAFEESQAGPFLRTSLRMVRRINASGSRNHTSSAKFDPTRGFRM